METTKCANCIHGMYYEYNGEHLGYKCTITNNNCFPVDFGCTDGKPFKRNEVEDEIEINT